jgi:polysaccharide chain length determinant protein (PEP-CTERM system associated)
MEPLVNTARRLLAAAWRKRLYVLATSWVICLIGWTSVMLLPPNFEASAQLYVAADPVLTPLLRGLAINGNSVQEFKLLRETLLSTPNLQQLIEREGLHAQGAGAREALIRSLRSRVTVVPQSRNLFTIHFVGHDPRRAYKIIQGLVNIYVERATVHNQGDIDNAGKFLQSQITYFHDQLKSLEARRATFQARYLDLLPGVNGVSAVQSAGAQVHKLETELQDAKAERGLLTGELSKTKSLLSAGQSAAGNPALATALANLARLRQKYTSNYPGVQAAEREVQTLEHAPSSGGTSSYSLPVANPVYEALHLKLLQIQTAILTLTRELARARTERTKLNGLARSQPGIEAKFINLNRNYGVLQKEYQDLISRREAMRIGAAANIDANQVQLQVINPPVQPRLPIGPNRRLLLIAVLILGVGAGLAVGVLLGELEGRVQSEADLRSFGLPVIGHISDLSPAPSATAPVMQLGIAGALLLSVFGALFIATFMIGSLG